MSEAHDIPARAAMDSILKPVSRKSSFSARKRRQTGLTLVELMVGLALGLLVIAVAIGALLVSRGYSGSVSDATQLQQQAAFAFRIVGQQIRQAGSIELNMATNNAPGSTAATDPADPVGFVVKYANFGQILSGNDTPGTGEYALTVGHQNYFEKQVDSASKDTMFRDCLGQGGKSDKDGNYFPIISRFVVKDNNLKCAGVLDATGAAAPPQSLIQNVSDFQVRYLIQENTAGGSPTIKKAKAAEVTNWPAVFAVEVCLDMIGDVTIDLPSTSTFKDCSGKDTSYGNRVHQVFRNVYQIRSQGILS